MAETTVRPVDTFPTAAAAQAYLDELAAELEKRGLHVKVRTPALTAKNPAVVGTDAHGASLSPGLGQEVRLLELEDLGWTWCWVWPGMRPGERGEPEPPPEIKPMCPAGDVEFAADRICKVVRLRDNPPEDDAPDGSG